MIFSQKSTKDRNTKNIIGINTHYSQVNINHSNQINIFFEMLTPNISNRNVNIDFPRKQPHLRQSPTDINIIIMNNYVAQAHVKIRSRNSSKNTRERRNPKTYLINNMCCDVEEAPMLT